MEWRDSGIVLSTRAHGEASVIVELLTLGHGRHLGLVRGGRSSRLRATLQAGNVVQATWRARLDEHLGHYTIELEVARAATLMQDRGRLAGLGVFESKIKKGYLRYYAEKVTSASTGAVFSE